MFAIVSTCLPDYYQGHLRPVLAVPVTKSTTHDDLVQLLREEYQALGEGGFPNVEDLENHLQVLKSNLPEQPFDDLDESTDEGLGETVFAYVAWYGEV